MEAELAEYAQEALSRLAAQDDSSLVSIEDRITTFNGLAAKQTFQYVKEGIKELGAEVAGSKYFHCGDISSSSEDEAERTPHVTHRRKVATEATPLIV